MQHFSHLLSSPPCVTLAATPSGQMLPLLLRAPGAGLAAAPAPACRRPKAASAPPPPSRRRAAAAPSPPRSAPTSPPADTSPPLPPPPPTWQAVPAGPLAEEHVRASQPGAGGVQPPAPGGRTLLLCVDPASPHPLRAVHWAAAKGLARPGDAAHLLSVLPIGAPARARTTHESAPSSRLTPGRVERTYEPSDFSPVSLNYGPKADPEMLRRAEEASRAVLGAACAALEKGGVYTVAHSLAERSWESVAAAVRMQPAPRAHSLSLGPPLFLPSFPSSLIINRLLRPHSPSPPIHLPRCAPRLTNWAPMLWWWRPRASRGCRRRCLGR